MKDDDSRLSWWQWHPHLVYVCGGPVWTKAADGCAIYLMKLSSLSHSFLPLSLHVKHHPWSLWEPTNEHSHTFCPTPQTLSPPLKASAAAVHRKQNRNFESVFSFQLLLLLLSLYAQEVCLCNNNNNNNECQPQSNQIEHHQFNTFVKLNVANVNALSLVLALFLLTPPYSYSNSNFIQELLLTLVRCHHRRFLRANLKYIALNISRLVVSLLFVLCISQYYLMYDYTLKQAHIYKYIYKYIYALSSNTNNEHFLLSLESSTWPAIQLEQRVPDRPAILFLGKISYYVINNQLLLLWFLLFCLFSVCVCVPCALWCYS